MYKYYLILGSTLVRGIPIWEGDILVTNAQKYINGTWVDIDMNEINDRLVGYDPYEEPGWRMYDEDIMDTIKEISEEKANKIMQKKDAH